MKCRRTDISFFHDTRHIVVKAWYGTSLCRPTIMKHTIPLNNSPSSSAPKTSPAKYSSHFDQNISSNIRITSFEMQPFCRRMFAVFMVSIFPEVILRSREIDGNLNSYCNNLYVWRDVYRSRSEYLIIFAEYTGLFLNFNCLNSSRTSPKISLFCSMLRCKFWSIPLLVSLHWLWRNQGGKGSGEFRWHSRTWILSSTRIQTVISGKEREPNSVL